MTAILLAAAFGAGYVVATIRHRIWVARMHVTVKRLNAMLDRAVADSRASRSNEVHP
jgi:hypothetical protein